MKKFFLFFWIIFLGACADNVSSSKGVYLLLDTSGTYTRELQKAQQIINYLLGTLEPGDSLAVARIDSGSFSEKDIIDKVTFDPRPSASNAQKRAFAEKVDQFVKTVKGSPYTDISGGLLQAVEFLNEAKVGRKYVLIYSDLKEELPEGYVRDFDIILDGFQVKALNVTKLRTDNVNPQDYLTRLEDWKVKVEQGGGNWDVVNDLDREDALLLM
jgi:hypothetical protein